MRLKQISASQLVILIYSSVGFESTSVSLISHVSHQEFCSMVYIALHFVIICYLIKIYRATLQLGMNIQQLTAARERSNSERINRSDIADPHSRHATEHDEREG